LNGNRNGQQQKLNPILHNNLERCDCHSTGLALEPYFIPWKYQFTTCRYQPRRTSLEASRSLGQDMSSILALHSVLFGKCGLAISLVLASIATTFQPNGYALSLGGKPTVPVSHL
jgi:hypothetical protein